MYLSKIKIVTMMILIATISCTSATSTQPNATKQAIPVRSEVGPQNMPLEILPVDAPFPTIEFAKPAFPNKKVLLSLPENGVVSGVIQEAIDNLAAEGGGTVVIPQGSYLCGRIELKSNINLEIPQGAELKFSGEVKDYLPVVFTRDEGVEIYSLGAFIYAFGAKNIAVTGKGRIVGPSIDCEIYKINQETALNIEQRVPDMPLDERIFDGKTNPEVFLPKTIAPINCENVLIEGVHLDQGLYWNVVPQYCNNVIIRGVTVTSFGHGRTDGIDIDSSSNVLIEYCSLDGQDDCYTLKSGRGSDGLRVNRPTENVVIRHSLALRGAGGIVCGTETAAGIKNVYMHDCVFDGTERAFRFKSRRTRGGRMSNIYVERVRANLIYDAFCIDILGSRKWMGDLAERYPAQPVTPYTPEYREISVHDVIIENCRNMISAIALPERHARNIFFGNAEVHCQEIGRIQDVTGINLKDIHIWSEDTTLVIDNADYASFYGINNRSTGRPVTIVQEGKDESKYLNVQEVGLEPKKYDSVRSGEVWLDTDGKPIHAHAFQIFYKDGTYYWYGENKEDAILGTNKMFGGFRLYTSKDFYNWTDEGLILTPESIDYLSPIHYTQKLERPHIIYNEKTGKYVCWAKSQDTAGYFVVLTADDFRGPYTFVRNLRPQGYGVGDFDLYVDEETGKAYVWFERPHWEMICSDLTEDYTDVVPGAFSTHFSGIRPPYTREAPAHFIHDGKFYMFTSGTTGYAPNPTQVHSFTELHGEYTDLGDPHINDPYGHSFNSQICCVLKVPGKKDLYVALADRWLPHVNNTDIPAKEIASKINAYKDHLPNPVDYSVPQVKNRRYVLVGTTHDVYDATYVFLPIVFKDGIPTIEWKEEWRLDDYD